MTFLLCFIIYLLIGLVLDVWVNGEVSIFTPVCMLIWPIPLFYEIFNR